eukprot:CAMPEP_0194302832 /NCGR_PEP_ID=MMETSP0171-20130528/706_1 /TAXON_ID=218684 /ORGANISM="Corethron pennatum, Strain L29A3" /LENGTH=145 /DNA_ID=CAMNT_0039053475 /DNA_START=15 /DNA_END=449 /DNA_ORIENTATION=+
MDKFDATANSRTYLSNFPPISDADVSIPAPSTPNCSPPPLEAPFSTWLDAKLLPRPNLLPVATSSNLHNTDVSPEIATMISPPPTTENTPRPPRPPHPPRQFRRTERSRRFAERRLKQLPPSRPQSAIIPSSPELLQPNIVDGSA